MCLSVFLIILLAIFMFYRGIKSSLKEVEEEVDSRISCMESKIDEIYTLVYKLGDVLSEIKHKTCKDETKTASTNRSRAAYAREYRRKKGLSEKTSSRAKSPSRSDRMKAYWEAKKISAALAPSKTEGTQEQ